MIYKILLVILCFVFLIQSKTEIIFVYKKCEFCSGQGTFKCNSCEGSGKIKVYGFDKKPRLEVCLKCDGKGYVDKCYRCDGKGKIKTDSIIFENEKR